MSKLRRDFIMLLSLMTVMVLACITVASSQSRDLIPSEELGVTHASVIAPGGEISGIDDVTSNVWVAAYYDVWQMNPLGSCWWAEPPDRLDYSNGVTHIIQFPNGNIRTNSPYFGPVGGVNLGDSLDLAYGTGRPGTPTHYADDLIARAHAANVRVLVCINAVCANNLITVLDPNGNGIIDGPDSAQCDVLTSSVAGYLFRHRYDGVDINIENGCGTFPSKSHIGLLLRRMRHYVDLYPAGIGGRMTITLSPLSGGQGSYPVADCNANVDQINPQTYDNQYAWNGCIGSNVNWYANALYPPTSAQLGTNASCFGSGNLVHTISQHGPNLWAAAGYNKSILGLGISTYGRLRSPNSTPFQAFTNDGYAANQPAIISGLLGNGGTLMPYDSITKTQSIAGTALRTASYNGTSASVTAGQGFYYTYPTPGSVAEDMAWLKANGYSGMMLFDYQMDCDPSNADITKRNPIINAAGQSAGGTSPVPPSVPTNQSPSNGAQLTPTSSLQVSWTQSPGATGYHFQLSTSVTFSPLSADLNLGTNGVIVSVLATPVTYYWRVSATGAGGTSAYSTVTSFATATGPTAPPNPPALVAPATDAVNQPTTLLFRWNRPAGATYFRLQVATDTLFTARFADDSTLTDTTRSVSNAAALETYYWRVSAGNPIGMSQWSQVRAFVTADDIAPSVAITSPAPAITVTDSVTISVTTSDNVGVVGVRFFVDGLALGVEDTTSPFSAVWNTLSVANGPHHITAVARDHSSNVRTSSPDSVVVLNAAAISDLWVYRDALEKPWINASWSGVYTFNNTEHSWSNPTSIKCATTAFGGLRLRSSNWGTTNKMNPDLYARVEFHLFNTDPGLRINVYLSNELGGTFPLVKYKNFPVDQWITVSTPMASLNPGNLPFQFVTMQTNNNVAKTFYIDDLRLVAARPGGLTPPADFGPDLDLDTPEGFELAENFPNPFNPTTTISIDLPEDAFASVKVYDILGREVASLFDERLAAGKYRATWNPGERAGGVYFVRMLARSSEGEVLYTRTRKIAYVK